MHGTRTGVSLQTGIKNQAGFSHLNLNVSTLRLRRIARRTASTCTSVFPLDSVVRLRRTPSLGINPSLPSGLTFPFAFLRSKVEIRRLTEASLQTRNENLRLLFLTWTSTSTCTGIFLLLLLFAFYLGFIRTAKLRPDSPLLPSSPGH